MARGIGLDFGTTNSALALAERDATGATRAHVATFATGATGLADEPTT